MRTISPRPANDRSRAGDIPWIDIGSRTSNIEELTIENGEMDATYTSRCLGSLKALRMLDYNYSSLRYDKYVLDRSGVSTILGVPLEVANTSLEFLSLHSGHEAPLEGDAAIPFSLNPFEKLQEATLSCHLWAPAIGGKHGKRQSIADDEPNPLKVDRDDSVVQKSKLFRPSKLVDILPGSVEMIEFYGKVAMEHMEGMLQGLIEHKVDRLPHLEEICFREVALMNNTTVRGMAKESKDQCSGIGVTLEIEY